MSSNRGRAVPAVAEFSKMYLVSESDFTQLQRARNRRQSKKASQPPTSSQPTDVQVVTNSLKAVSQRRKREAVVSTVPPTRMRNYTSHQGGVPSMTDKQVAKPLKRLQQPGHRHRESRTPARSRVQTRAQRAASLVRKSSTHLTPELSSSGEMLGTGSFETPSLQFYDIDSPSSTAQSTPTPSRLHVLKLYDVQSNK